MLQMMKVRNVTRTRKMRVVRKTRRVRGLAELTVGSGGGTDQQVTVHTHVSVFPPWLRFLSFVFGGD